MAAAAAATRTSFRTCAPPNSSPHFVCDAALSIHRPTRSPQDRTKNTDNETLRVSHSRKASCLWVTTYTVNSTIRMTVRAKLFAGSVPSEWRRHATVVVLVVVIVVAPHYCLLSGTLAKNQLWCGIQITGQGWVLCVPLYFGTPTTLHSTLSDLLNVTAQQLESPPPGSAFAVLRARNNPPGLPRPLPAGLEVLVLH